MENEQKQQEEKKAEKNHQKRWYKNFARYLKENWESVFAVLFGAVLIGSFFLYNYKFKNNSLKPKYAMAYTLVRDSISQSANIVINLPPGTAKEGAENKVAFDPEIQGKWIASQDNERIVFDPDEKLELGKYYTVSFNDVKGRIGKDFQVKENPEVISVFPRANSETHEKSDITIIFNRPMVPLSTLDVMEEFDIPVEINPKTKGKYKWIGTRTLQFIPDSELIASANYEIKIKSDFESLDGLSIKNFEQKFTTRKLRYSSFHQDQTIYRQPISIYFNQPIDLEKTVKELSLENETSKNKIDFIAEYGTRKKYNEEKNEYEDVIDESILSIYNKKDRHGREKFWDFNNNYYLRINKAYSRAGDIDLNEKKEIRISVGEAIKNISAESDRTRFSTKDFFDPEGKLWIKFYEDIDLEKSEIHSNKLVSKGYGEKCKNAKEGFYSDVGCEKETDKSKIFLIFDKSNIRKSEILRIDFNGIKNLSGLLLNKDSVIKNISVVPELKILSTIPSSNFKGASVVEMYICSNSPLSAPAKEDISLYIKSNLEYEFKKWYKPILITRQTQQYHKCQAGEFETQITYGLMPEKDYEINIKAVDDFGAEKNINLKFKTGKIKDYYLNFYHFQKKYNVTTPDKTRFTYAVENMEYVDMHICQLSPHNMLNYLEKKPNYWQDSSAVKNCITSVSERINLEPKYWIKNYFKVDLKDYVSNPRGHYILTFSHPNYKEQYGKGRKVHERTYSSITNLSVVEKKVNAMEQKRRPDYNLSDKNIKKLDNIYWVSNINRLDPVPSAKIDIYAAGNNLSKAKTVYTDASGIAKTGSVKDEKGIIVSIPNDSAILTSGEHKFEWASVATTLNKIYLYTDRPIYRPGHTAHIKGMFRVGYDGEYEIFKKKIPIKIFNSRNEEIFSENAEVNDYGTFNIDFTIAKDAPLGRYRVRHEDGYGYGYFDVEEYVPAPFKVEAKTEKEEYISKDTLNLDIEADYYFGVPLEGGEVEYSIASQDYYFDKYKGDYFNFGSSWYYCYDCSYGDKFILRNKVSLNQDGKAKISHSLDFDKLFEADNRDSKIFTVYITVKNSSGQQVSTQKSFIAHAGEFYLGINTDKKFLGKNEEFLLKLKSVDVFGEELKVNNIELTLNKVKWIKSKRKEVDGAYYYRWEKKLEEVEKKNVSTDDSGGWQDSFSLKEEGSYEIIAKADDKRGNTIAGEHNLYVWGDGYADIMPRNDDKLEIISDKTSLDVGDTASIIIKSPYEKGKALITVERGKVFSYKVVDINQSLYKYEFPIKEEYIPNVYASAVLLSGKPEVRFGKLQFNINRDEKELDISVSSNKDHYLPGEEVELKFDVKNSLGAPVEAEFSVAVADLSVLALKGNPKKNPLVFFYGGFPLTVETISNVKNILYEVDVAEKTKGGGGSDPEDLAKKKRGIFKDTAYWQAVITTNKEGKANIKFTLPDNLTTWQIEAVGITKDTKLGAEYGEFIARKNIMAVPLKPRFIVPGDEFSIGAKVFNQTDKKQKLDVSFASESLALKDNNLKKIVLEEGKSKTIYFKVFAPAARQEGLHQFILSAKNKDYEDTVEQSIKITRNDTYEATATAGYSSEPLVNEFVYLPDNIIKDKGDLSINHSATLAVFLSKGLKSLFQFPYGCSEQIASKLNAIAIVKKGLNIENISDKFKIPDIEFDNKNYTADEAVEIGIKELYKNQSSGGGFSYYPSLDPNMHLTLHVASVLKNLKDAGYNVEANRIKRAFDYINRTLKYDKDYYENKNFLIIAGYTLSELKEFGAMDAKTMERIRALRRDDKFINEDISNVSLSYLAMLLARKEASFGKDFKKNIYNNLENRIEIDSRGSFLPLNRNSVVWRYYETPAKNTALMLKALIENNEDNEILDRILRWLLRSRTKDGSWGSTNNTVEVIDAMIEYLKWQREAESNFNLSLLVNGSEKQKFTYAPETILEQNSLVLPLGDLEFGAINTIDFKKDNLNNLKNNFYYDISMKYYLPIDTIPPRDEGFTITRKFYSLEDEEFETPLSKAKVGDVLKGHIEIMVPKHRNFVMVEDFIPAGVEIVNFNLATENQALLEQERAKRGYGWYDWQMERRKRYLNPDFEEVRDDRLFNFKINLSPGTYELDYFVRVLIPGKYHHLPAVISEMYNPENFARTSGSYFEVE